MSNVVIIKRTHVLSCKFSIKCFLVILALLLHDCDIPYTLLSTEDMQIRVT